MPEQVPVKEGVAKLPGTSLWYWDTGGEGDTVVLLHAASGSGAFWGYQQPVLAEGRLSRHQLFAARLLEIRSRRSERSGHRVRGSAEPGRASSASANFMSVGLAAGGIVATDYALSHPERL